MTFNIRRLFNLVTFALLICAGPAFAAPGDLDTTFNSTGKVFVDVNNSSDDRAWAIAHDAAGRIYVGGAATNAQGGDFAVIRLTSTGALDTSFGTGGKAVIDIGAATMDTANALAIDRLGSVYIAGISNAQGNQQFTLVKLDSSGHVATSFGTAGRAIVPTSTTGNESCCSIVLDDGGSIYLVGATYLSGKQTLKVARLTATGQLDATYGTLGIATTRFYNSTNGAGGILDASGNLYVLASVSKVVDSNVNIDFALILLDHSGNVVTGFGEFGAAYVDFGTFDLAASFVRDGAGNFFIGGQTPGADHIHYDFAVAKVDASGNPIAAFGSAGKKTVSIAGSDGGSTLTSVMIDRDGNLYLEGGTIASNVVKTAIVAVDGMTGALNPGFGTAGTAIYDISGGIYNGVAAALDPLGRIDFTANRGDFIASEDFPAVRVVPLATNEIFGQGFESP